MPVDSDFFNNANNAQLLWYYYNIMQDEKEQFERDRDMTEYLASFISPSAVKDVLDRREMKENFSEDAFNDVLEELFGKRLEEIVPQDNGFTQDNLDFLDNIPTTTNANPPQRHKNFKHWMKTNLE